MFLDQLLALWPEESHGCKSKSVNANFHPQWSWNRNQKYLLVLYICYENYEKKNRYSCGNLSLLSLMDVTDSHDTLDWQYTWYCEEKLYVDLRYCVPSLVQQLVLNFIQCPQVWQGLSLESLTSFLCHAIVLCACLRTKSNVSHHEMPWQNP